MFRKLFRIRALDAIDDAVWAQGVASMPFLDRLSAADRVRLIELARRFTATKAFSGTHGLEVSESIKAAIALQACLPVLNLGLKPYDDFVEVVVYPDRFLAPRSRTDEAGVVHEGIEELAGEAMDGGPVVLAWPDITPESPLEGSVVIHEFIHKLDMLDGEADGCPPMSAGARSRWVEILGGAYERFCVDLEEVEAAIPIDVDPESEAGAAYFSELVLDPYAATDEAEFFAVSGEVFFTNPEVLLRSFPELFDCYRQFFRFDLLARDCD
jgi:Mlc titration factor MtfA (ptsG expression regulator)